MANHHFARLADVWKHLALVEILAREHPVLYWESHAGSGAYAMVDDPERRFGAMTFWTRAATDETLRRSRYFHHLRQLNPGPGLIVYPGSCLLAMAELGQSATYLLCDRDPGSVSDLEAWAALAGLGDRVQVLAGDGLDALHHDLVSADPTGLLVHIDPFDPWARGTADVSALELAGELANAGARLVYWYGYDQPGQRAWALEDIAALTSSAPWCGDMLVAAAHEPAVNNDGDLGASTTPGTGFGVVCANLAEDTLQSCTEVGEALSRAWREVFLPTGGVSRLDFCVRHLT